jgi:enoyl-CoA hydratase/carnithine racemase
MGSLVLKEYDHKGRITLTLHRPEKRNALSAPLLEELLRALKECAQDPSLKLLVITGAGDHFCAGGDLREFLEGDPQALSAQTERVRELFSSLLLFPLPTLARVKGYCLAGGFGIALACDMIVASEEAEFGAPEVLVSLWPSMLSLLLFRHLPEKIALELIYTGRRISAQTLSQLGVLNRLVSREELEGAVEDLARPILSLPSSLLRKGKKAFLREFRMKLLPSLFTLRQDFLELLMEPETREGLRQFFTRTQATLGKE